METAIRKSRRFGVVARVAVTVAKITLLAVVLALLISGLELLREMYSWHRYVREGTEIPISDLHFGQPKQEGRQASSLTGRSRVLFLYVAATVITKQPQSGPAVPRTSQSPAVGNRTRLGNPDSFSLPGL
jgi:hypothetical protein